MKVKLYGTAYAITPEMISAAMTDYDDHHRKSATDAGRDYVLIHQGQHYPPKRIVKLALGPNTPLSGGEGRYGANTILRELGFVVEAISQNPLPPPDQPAKSQHDERLELPPPTMDELLGQLFAQQWLTFHDHYKEILDGHFLGVYVLTWSNDDLSGQPVTESTVKYVGMTQTRLHRRLHQFRLGLDDGKHHSGARRYFTDIGKGKAYKNTPDHPNFYVAAVAIPCTSQKSLRQAPDLRKLGEVARLEYYVLARIKEKVGDEPELNRK